MQMDSRAFELAEKAIAHKKNLIRIFSRDGVIDDEEMRDLQDITEIEVELKEKGEDELFAAAMYKRGRNSQRVQRIGRQLFAEDGGSAA